MQLQKADVKILLRFMVAMAAADDRLHSAEVSVMSGVFEKITGSPLDETLLRNMFALDRNEQLAILDDESFTAKCSPELKRLILKACYLVKISDRAIAGNELDMMATIAARLNISGSELSELIHEVRG